eukprot:1160677-Pelagomonas_calceolata.AAC.16
MPAKEGRMHFDGQGTPEIMFKSRSKLVQILTLRYFKQQLLIRFDASRLISQYIHTYRSKSFFNYPLKSRSVADDPPDPH